MELHILPQIADDELLFSYLHRVATMNVVKPHHVLGLDGQSKVSYDGCFDMSTIFDTLDVRVFGGPLRFIMDTTMLPAILPTYTWQQQMQVCNILNSRTKQRSVLQTPHKPSIKRLKICPACLAEDLQAYGSVIYRRSHQILGVLVCTKHRVWLEVVSAKAGKEFVLPLEVEKKKLTDVLLDENIKYSKFCQSIMAAELDCTISDIQAACSRMFLKQGYTLKDAETLANEISIQKYCDIQVTPRSAKALLSSAHYCQRNLIIPALFFLVKSIDDLRSFLPKKKIETGIMLALRVLHTKAKIMLRKIAETLIFPAFFSSFFSDYVVLF